MKADINRSRCEMARFNSGRILQFLVQNEDDIKVPTNIEEADLIISNVFKLTNTVRTEEV